jgi:hypothetical protein
VRPARDDGLAGLDEVTAGWAHARRLAKVPGAAVWHIDGGERR